MNKQVLPLNIVLASASPRRLELLTQAGVSFSVVVPGVDETPIAAELPKDMVERLALLKAKTVADTMVDSYVIGADTTVFIDNRSLGKPLSEQEACEMLMCIQGRTHQVWGGIAIVHAGLGISRVWSHVTDVTMRPMNKQQVLDYIATGEPLDKAGSYAIQGIGLQFVDTIQGSYSNVVGLNIAALMSELQGIAILSPLKGPKMCGSC
jgi:septum formation protein